MKRIIAAGLVLSFMLSLCGCGGGDSSNAGRQEAVSSISETASSQAGSQQTGQAPAARGAVTELEALNVNGTLSRIQPLGGDRAAVQYSAMENGTFCSYAAVIDTASDKLISSGKLGSGFEKLAGVMSDGAVLTYDNDKGELILYKSDMTLDKKTPLPEEEVREILAADDDVIYAVCRNKVLRLESGGSTEAVAELSEDAVIERFDPLTGLALYSRLTDDEGGGKCYILDTYDNKTTQIPADSESCIFQGGRLTVRGGRVYPGEEGSGRVLEQKTLLTAYDESCSPDKAYQLSGVINIKNKMSDPVVFAAERGLDEESADVNALFIDMANGSFARAELSGDDICDITPCFMSEGECVLAVTRGEQGGEDNSITLVCVDISQLDFEPLTNAEADTPENNKKQAEENKKLLADYADTIAKSYNVGIILGDDSLKIDYGGVFEPVSTDEADSEMSIYRTLMLLEDTLALYPEGFFDKFYEDGMNGLTFALVLSMRADEYIQAAAGLAMIRDEDHYIALDVSKFDADPEAAVIVHELWHSTENQIERKDPEAFDDGIWNTLNPADFGYIDSFDDVTNAATEYDKYVLEQGSDDPYFTRRYGMYTPGEDRATLIEGLFSGQLAPTPAESVRVINESCPHLKAKLDYMAERMRNCMGVVSWEMQS